MTTKQANELLYRCAERLTSDYEIHLGTHDSTLNTRSSQGTIINHIVDLIDALNAVAKAKAQTAYDPDAPMCQDDYGISPRPERMPPPNRGLFFC